MIQAGPAANRQAFLRSEKNDPSWDEAGHSFESGCPAIYHEKTLPYRAYLMLHHRCDRMFNRPTWVYSSFISVVALVVWFPVYTTCLLS